MIDKMSFSACLVGSTGADDGDDNDWDDIHGDIYKIMFVVIVIFCWYFVFLILWFLDLNMSQSFIEQFGIGQCGAG